MTTLTQQWSITINLNGTNYTFTDPHPITDLMDQLNAEQTSLALWQQRATDSQARIDELTAEITTLCTGQ